jgi:hypothetical protein
MELRYAQAPLRNTGNPVLRIDTHLLEMKIEVTIDSKDDSVPSQIPGVLTLNQRLGLPTKVSFKGGSHLSTPNPSTFLASSNLGDEISFKGGSL